MNQSDQHERPWLYTISSKSKLINLNFKEIWRYKDLLFLFVKRDIVTVYKQTILGPLWYFIQPLFTSIIFTVIFNDLAGIPVKSGVPAFLFNLAGVTAWNYFKECLMGTSDTFTKNQAVFGKVYFPRVIVPMSIVISNLVKFGIQILVFVGFYVYFIAFTNEAYAASINISFLLLPILVFIMGLLGLGFGMLISSMTTKYRDLTFLVSFGVQLLMYGSAVMYPLSFFEEKLPNIFWLVAYNPLTIVIEAFRYTTLSVGHISTLQLIYIAAVSILVFLLGLIVFNSTEKKFIDTV